MECLPGEMEGEETKRRGQESKLNGNTIFCHPGDPITSQKNPTIINSLAVKLKDFMDQKCILYTKEVLSFAKKALIVFG